MQYIEQQLAEFKAEFAKRRKRKRSLAVLAFSLWNWRCPDCNK